MSYRFNFETSAAVMPSRVTEFLQRAGLCDMRVFVYLCSVGGNADIDSISAAVGFSREDVISSLAFWRGTGIVTEQGDVSVTPAFNTAQEKGDEPIDCAKEKPEAKKKIERAVSLPQYTSDELSEILDKRKDVALLIDECQRILGKMLNLHEINVLVGLIDYLELDDEYILLLVKHCTENGKRTLHYIEKTAFALYDSGIMTSPALTAELSRREAAASAEGRIRSIFGIGSRALTTREKKEISAWVNDMKFSMDIIERAYEITVDATSKPTLHYANTVLERWNSEGLDTLEKINDSYKESKNAKAASDTDKASSFDTDEFFEAAVKRSFGEH